MKAHPQVVEYAESVLTSILATVEDGFRKFPHGGLAVGGVLFGRGDRHLVRILAVRAIPCDHSAGPSFTLSAADHERLAFLLSNYQGDPELSDLIPVGWYHSHTRSGLHLTPSDIELHERHFPEPWQITLVLRPDVDQPTSAAIFVRAENGDMPLEPELLIEGLEARTGATAITEAAIAGTPKPEDSLVPEPPAEREAPPEPTAPVSTEEPSGAIATEPVEEVDLFASIGGAGSSREWGRGSKWALRLVLVAVLGAGSWAGGRYLVPEEYWAAMRVFGASAGNYLAYAVEYWKTLAISSEEPRLSLRTTASGHNLMVRWDSSSRVLAGVTRGLLEIRDGATETKKELSLTDLIEGSYSFRRISADVQARLTVYRGEGQQHTESTRFLGMASGQTREGSAVVETPAELRADVERLRTAIAQQSERARVYQDSLAALRELEQSRQGAAGAAGTAPQRTATTAPPARSVLAQKAPALVQKTPALVQQPPVTLQQSAPTTATTTAPARGNVAVSARTGKLIWTGFLPAGQTLTLAAGKPNRGTVSGAFPGVPIRISVYPGEMTGAGLTVYSSDSRQASHPRVEQPGPQNSWTRTTYRYDEARSRTATIVEQPGAGNGWRRLVVRAEGRPLSVLVVEWKRAE